MPPRGLLDRARDRGVAVADVHDCASGAEVEVSVPVDVEQVAVFCPIQDERVKPHLHDVRDRGRLARQLRRGFGQPVPHPQLA
jgi:hypothetical protein